MRNEHIGRGLAALIALILLAFGAPVAAQEAETPTPGRRRSMSRAPSFRRPSQASSPDRASKSGGQLVAVKQLKPGEFIWAPQVAPEGPVVIVVSIAQQRAYAYRNGLPIGISTVSTLTLPSLPKPTAIAKISAPPLCHGSWSSFRRMDVTCVAQ